MTLPRTFHIEERSASALSLAKDNGNDHPVTAMQSVTLGSKTVVAGIVTGQVVLNAFDHGDRRRGRDERQGVR